MEVTIESIIQKLFKKCIIRFVNGNIDDHSYENISIITPLQAFQNKDWVLDLEQVLSKEEFAVWCKARSEWKGDLAIFGNNVPRPQCVNVISGLTELDRQIELEMASYE